MKKEKVAVLVSCSNHYNNRIKFIEENLKAKNYKIIYIVADFNHFTKEYYEPKEANVIIHVPRYKKNISISRIVSYFVFSKKLFQEVKKIKPNLIYALIPPNFIAHYMAKYKKLENTKLVFDIFDMWPEAYINKSKILMPLFNIWRNLRNKNLNKADIVITECNYFKNVLNNQIKISTETLYLTKEETNTIKENLLQEKINICYLGSINNIIDIDKTVAILSKINKIKPVIFNIIGHGEKQEELITKCQRENIEVNYLGKIYENEKKQEIFNQCDFGINILKEDLVIGLSMKAIDYLEGGLPIITNIQEDLGKLIQKYKAGYVINSEDDVNEILKLSKQDIGKQKENAYILFQDVFSIKKFNNNLNEILKKIQ